MRLPITLSVILSCISLSLSYQAVPAVPEPEQVVQDAAPEPEPVVAPAKEFNELAIAQEVAREWSIPDTDVEYRLVDGRRVDIWDRKAGIAWEVDWGKKWAEGIGQALSPMCHCQSILCERGIAMQTTRLESMSPRGFMRLFREEDGDIIITVGEGGGNGEINQLASVQFCTPFAGGGVSKRLMTQCVMLV